MAVIVRFRHAPMSGRAKRNPTEAECGHHVVTLDDGTRLLQLDTYGSKDRVIPGKTSQTLQLDRERAVELKSILETAFPGI